MRSEPVALLAAAAVVVVWGASLFDVVLDTSAVENVLVSGVLLVTAVLQRSRVSPA